MPSSIDRKAKYRTDILKEDDIIDDFSIPPIISDVKNRFVLAKYFILGYLVLVGLAFMIKAFLPAVDLSEIFGILEKIGYIVATIIGFYFTKK